MSAAPHTQISVGVVVERRKAESPWIDFTWRPVTATSLNGGSASVGRNATHKDGEPDVRLSR